MDDKYSIDKGAKVKICGSCADSRDLKNASLIEDAEISTMVELTLWVVGGGQQQSNPY